MNENIDKLLNEYIDGNLSAGEIEELNSFISGNENVLAKLKGLKIVDSHLKEMDTIDAPENISGRIMHKINRALSGNLSKSYFLRGMVGLFSVSFISLMVFFFTYFSGPDKDYPAADNTINTVSTFISGLIDKIAGQIAGTDLMLVLSVIALIVMLSIYFLYETHKDFRKKLSSISR